MSAAAEFVFNPVALFARRSDSGFRWQAAFVPPALCAVLHFGAVRLLSATTLGGLVSLASPADPHLPRWETMSLVFGLMSAMSYLVLYAFTAVTLICLDVLFADSKRGLKLVELAGLAFIPQVLATAALLCAVIFGLPQWSGPPIGSVADASSAIAAYRASVRAQPAFIAASVVEFGCIGWTIVLAAVSLYTTAKLTRRQVVLAAATALGIYTTVYLGRLASGI